MHEKEFKNTVHAFLLLLFLLRSIKVKKKMFAYLYFSHSQQALGLLQLFNSLEASLSIEVYVFQVCQTQIMWP